MRKIFKVMPIYLILIFLSVFVIKTEIIKAEGSDFTIENGILTKYTGAEENVVIPNSVTEIGYEAFIKCSKLRSIEIPNSVTKIGYSAFSYCSNLRNIEIPSSVIEIGGSAFYSCSNLGSIKIPNSVTEIVYGMFSNCSSLRSIEIPNSVTKISGNAFYNCINLTNIEIPNSVTEIGDEAFRNCSNLSSIEIPNSVIEIGNLAFCNCSNLTNIEIPSSVIEIGSSAFSSCSNLSSVKISNGALRIGSGAFSYCSNLNSIEIPSSVIEIGSSAFYGCTDNLIIYGKKSSYAQQYANGHSIEFREITDKDDNKPTEDNKLTEDNNKPTEDNNKPTEDNNKPTEDNNKPTEDGNKPTEGDNKPTENDGVITKYTKPDDILKQLKADSLLSDVKISAETVEGAFIKIPFVGEFPLIRFNAEMDIKLSDKIQAKVNTESKKIEILIGFKDFSGSANISSENQSTNYWSESYKEVKSLYTGMTGKKVDTTKLWNDFSKLRGKLKEVDGKMVVNGKMQIAGYMEFDYSSGTIQYSEGGVILETSLGSRTDMPIPQAPILYLSFGINGSADGSFYIVKTSEHYDISANLGLALKLDARIGLGSKKANLYIDGGVQGSIDTNVKLPASELKNALELYLTGGLVFEYNVFGFFHDTKSKDFFKIELFPNQKIVNIESLDLNNDLEMISRDYLSKSKIKLFNNDENSFKKDDVFPYNLANLVKLDNGQLLLIWIDDDTTKSLANRTSLMYSLYNGNSWSEPEFIEKTEFANYSPEIYNINNKVYLLWQKSNKVFDDNINVNDIPENIDLAYSVFENGKFSEPINLNEVGNKNYEMMQTIASDGKNVCVAWLENADNNINFSSNKYSIHLKEFDGNNWQQEKEIESNIDNISSLNLEYINNKPVVFYGLSKNDNDLQDIYMYKDNVSQKLLQDCKLTKILDKNLYYIYNSTLYCYDLNTNKNQSLGINIDYEYDILKYKNKTYIFYTIFNNFRTELVMRVYDLSLNEWSDEIKLTNYDKYIRNYSPIIDENGKLTVALNIAEVNDDKKEDGIYGKTTLNVIDINKIVDLQIGDYIYYDYSLVSPNAELPLTFTIKNVGTEKVNNVDVIIYDADNNILQNGTIECEIQVGEEREVIYNYKLPENIKYGDIKLELDMKGDIDKSNNSLTTKIGYADICLNDLIIEGTGNNAKIKGSVSNIGYNEAKNVNVNLYKNNITGDKIFTTTFSNINAGETKDFEVQLPEEIFNLTNNTISNIVYIEAVTDTQESITTNNDGFISIGKPEEMGIILNKQKESLNIGETKKLYITYNEIASSSEEVWSSDNDKIVSVDEKGNITAKSSGTANITVEKNNKKAVCIVEVGEDVKVSSIKFDTNFENLFLGDTKQLKATILPSEAKNKKIIWTTSDDAIASVDDNGLVTAKSNGLVDIIATTVDGNKSTICKIKVYSSYKPNDNNGNAGDNQSTVDNNNGNTGNNQGTTNNNNGNTGNNQGTTDNNNGNTGNNQGTTDNNNGNTGNNQGTTDNNNTTSKDKKILCYITYKLKSGKNNSKNLNFYERGEYVQLQPAYRKGYKFVGWYTDKSCKNKVSSMIITADTTLYVKWKKIVVKTPKIKSLKDLGNKILRISFKKYKTLDGYQIVYSKNMKFKNKQTKFAHNTPYELGHLSKGKYAVKIRGYIIDSTGRKVYSKYTKAKVINIK